MAVELIFFVIIIPLFFCTQNEDKFGRHVFHLHALTLLYQKIIRKMFNIFTHYLLSSIYLGFFLNKGKNKFKL